MTSAGPDTTTGDPSSTELRPLLLDDERLVRAVASGRQRNATVPFRRVELRYVDLKAGRRLQVTTYDETQADIHNHELGAAAEQAVDDLVGEPYASWHVDTVSETIQLRVTKKGRSLLHRSARVEPVDPERRHNRTKRRRLEESDPVFRLLGITTDDGHLKPSRVSKFRQVQDFLAALDPVVDSALPARGGESDALPRSLRLVDLGCGNAYLTFAAFRYLTEVRQIPVEAVGVDVKAQARDHNTRLAQRLGVSSQLRFIEGTIASVDVVDPPDLAVALHACDTATDEALARAVRWRTPVIVAAPCCHHDLQRQLDGAAAPDGYRLVTRHGILRERLADVLTDALRAAVLRLLGYRVDVMEFVDSQHTPRNLLIRAVRTGTPPDATTLEAYFSLVTSWDVRPALATLLADELQLVKGAPAAAGAHG